MIGEPDHLQGLNPPQRAAVEHVEGPLLILAGAGSGKTRVLTRRVAHLLHVGVKPWNILAVTFTNKAAGEMKERVGALVGEDRLKGIWVSTFHSAAVRILRAEAEALGYSKRFVIYDTDDQRRLVKEILSAMGADPQRHPPRGFLSDIDRAKNQLQGPDQLGAVDRPYLQEVFRRYEARLMAASAMDFNDLINKVVLLFQKHPAILRKYQDRFQYLMVDEYQDTNRAQYKLTQLLASRDKNIAVVGDDDQSIYSFRGADIRNILDFERDYPDAKVVILDQNYRSTNNILRAAGSVVKNNTGRKEKELWTDAGDGEPLRLLVARDEEEEAERVGREIQKLIAQGRRPRDFAIIYRTNARSRLFEAELRRSRTPYHLVGARSFFERQEIRDVVGYLKLLTNPADDMSLLRVLNAPRRGIGQKTEAKIRALADAEGCTLLEATRRLSSDDGRTAKKLKGFIDLIDQLQDEVQRLSPGELVVQVVEESGYGAALRAEDTDESKERMQNLQALAQDVEGVEGEAPLERLQSFLDQSALTGQSDQLPDAEDPGVTLLTAHLAKGLEFPVVFVVGMIEGGFPHARSREREEDLEEERRLAYVAITRARERLYLAYNRIRKSYGYRSEPAQPSRFLREIPRGLFGGAAPGPRHSGIGSLSAARARREAFAKRHNVNAAPDSDDRGHPIPTAPARATPQGAPGRPGAPLQPRRPGVPLQPRRPSGPAGDAWDTLRRAQPPAHQAEHEVAELEEPEEYITVEPEGPHSFRKGVRVMHPAFGLGEIIETGGSPSNPRLRIRFRDHGLKTLLPLYARLEIVLD